MALLVLLAVVAGCSSSADRDGGSPERRRTPPSRSTATGPSTGPTASVAASTSLVDRACDGGLVARQGPVLADPSVDEASGVVVGRRQPTVSWVHNDSGSEPGLYGVRADGTVQAVDVTGATNVDWEDLAPAIGGGPPGLWIADTGGNLSPRTTVELYRVDEPGPDDTSVAARRVEVRYPDGPHDVEALLADPDGSLYLLTKEAADTGAIYEVDAETALASGAADAGLVGSFDGPGKLAMVTGGDIADDGGAVVLRTYSGVWLYRIEAEQSLVEALASEPCEGASSDEVQGEAVGFTPDGSSYVTIAESRLTEQPARLTTVRAG